MMLVVEVDRGGDVVGQVHEEAEVIVTVGHVALRWLPHLLFAFGVTVLAFLVMCDAVTVVIISLPLPMDELGLLDTLELEVIDVDTTGGVSHADIHLSVNLLTRLIVRLL